MKKTQDYIDQAIQNITEDRETTRDLLDDAIKYLAKDESGFITGTTLNANGGQYNVP